MDVYGLKNCDKCRQAVGWLKDQGLAHTFHDVRQNPPSKALLTAWLTQLGAERLINRQSTTWRALSEKERALGEGSKAHLLLEQYPALMKRPVFVLAKAIIVGWGAEQKAALRKA